MKSKKEPLKKKETTQEESGPNVWSFVNSISYNKEYLFNETTASVYEPWKVNKSFSYFPDTVLYANEMNMHFSLDKQLQHDYLINIIRRRKRFEKWAKDPKDEDLKTVQEYYKCSSTKAKDALRILTEEQLAIIRKRIDKGGVI